MRELIAALGLLFSTAGGLAQAAPQTVVHPDDAARRDWFRANVATKGPVVMVTHPDFGFGQPVQAIEVTNDRCTSAPAIAIPSPAHSEDGSQATAIGYCVDGRVRVDITFPGGGYDPSQVASITGGGTAGSSGRLVLLGTANPADPTGAHDSAAAIENAVDYAVRLGSSGEGYPAVRVPAGSYKVTAGLRIPGIIDFGGDSTASSALTVGTGPQDLIYYYLCETCTSFAVGDNTGGVHNLTLQGSGHRSIGTLLAIEGNVGNHFHDLSLQNSGGIGIHIIGTERFGFDDIYISNVRWPGLGGGNETHIRKLIIWGPGFSDSGSYQYGPNTVNGVATGYLGGEFTGGTLTRLTCDGRGECTLTEAGHKGIAPFAVGAWFQISGVADLTAANGVFQAAAVANHSPAAGDFQVTFKVVSSSNQVSPFYYDSSANIQIRDPISATPTGSSAGLSAAKFTIADFPVPYQAWNVGGGAENIAFENGSIKTTAYAGCFGGYQLGVGQFAGFYCEAAQPSLSPSFTNGGWQPFTYTSAAFPASATGCSLAAYCSITAAFDPAHNWFINYSSSTQYVDLAPARDYLQIMPPDYDPSSTAPSRSVTGVNRNQFEVIQGVFASDGRLYISGRTLAGFGGISSPATWPAGSILGWINSTHTLSNGASHLVLANNHLNSQFPLPTGWTAECNDNGPNICASVVLGVTPDYVVTFPAGTKGQTIIGGGVTIDGYNLEGYCNDTNRIGNECIKVQGGGAVWLGGGASTLNFTAAAGAIANGVTQGSTGTYYATKAGIIPVYYPSTRTYSAVNARDNDSDAMVIVPRPTTTPYSGWAESTILGQTGEGGASVLPLGATPGYHDGFGHQYTTADCWYDTPSASQTTVNERFCFKGGPGFTGSSLGFEHDLWNPATQRWVTAFSCHADPSDPTRDDCMVAGALAAGSYSGDTYMATVAAGQTIAAGSCKAIAVAIAGFPTNLAGHGVVPVSVPNPTVLPGGLVALAPYGLSLTSTGARLTFCDWGSAAGNAPAGSYSFKVF